MRRGVTACLLVAACALVGAGPAGAQLTAQEASLKNLEIESTSHQYPMVEGTTETYAAWSVVPGTGNCCENYITATADGRLLDFGGTYLNFSDDRGESWTSVRPGIPQLGGEGAVTVAPNGDVLGIGWDPYSGDHLLSYKYEAASGNWKWSYIPLKTPFYDREWIGVVPGPITILGQTVPYVVFIKGGWPSKEAWLYSTDGLTYVQSSSKFVDSTASASVSAPLEPVASPSFDAIQANGGMGLTPLGKGRALAAPDLVGSWALLDPATLRWSGYRWPGGAPSGLVHLDGSGRLHNVIPGAGARSFAYRVSRDGGSSWVEIEVPLPPEHTIEEIDFRVHSGVGIAAVAIHGHDSTRKTDQDLLFKLDVRGTRPALLRRYAVGRGDVNGSSGVGADVRFDFETIALLPDGRVAMSFYDSTTKSTPALAIERSEPLPKDFGKTPPPVVQPVPAGSSGVSEAHGAPASGGAPAQPARPIDQTGPPGGRHRVRLMLRRRGGRVEFSGTIHPRHPRHVVLIQRRSGRRWVTLARVRGTQGSSFRVRRRAGAGRYRAVVAADAAGHERGVSREVRVR